ncbi:MAG: hypothetical protein ACOCPZ_03725 [Natrialbaceae archaeon]
MSPAPRSPSGVRIAPVSPAFVERATAGELDDWLSYFDPDVVTLACEEPAPRAANAVRRQLDPGTVFFDPVTGSGSRSRVIGGVGLAFVTRFGDLTALTADVTGPTVVLSPLLELNVDTTSLSTDLVGRER